MSDKLNILILHRMGDPRTWLTSVRDLEYCLPDYAPEHHYIVHNAALPPPKFIKDIDFHGIILGSTFLCNRCLPALYKKTLEDYSFIGNSDAFKIALPQDDYDCSAILEKWMLEWNIDLVYTVCPNHWDILYPTISLDNKIKLGYTSYISEKMIERCKSPKPFSSRRTDVSYRSKLSYLGQMRYTKGTIGNVFVNNIPFSDYVLNISTHPKDTIFGERWLDFIEDSKFVLGSNSGSSILDPEGELAADVNRYLASHRNATFEEVRKACFPEEDGTWNFTAISPRNIEAALLETAQICVPGPYSGIMQPEEHYIPIEPDGSNIQDVLAKMRDTASVGKMIRRCKEAFLAVEELRYRHLVQEILETITHGVSAKRITGTKPDQMEKHIMSYKEFDETCSKYYWPYQRLWQRFKRTAKYLAKKIKDFLTSRK